MRYFIKLAYKGTNYHGWQIQRNALTVQGIIQDSLEQVLQSPIPIMGSSRTDTGVHAQQQWAHLDLEDNIDTTRLHRQLNAILPLDIAIIAILPTKNKAHARFDAVTRTYEYTIVQAKNPFLQETSFYFTKELDIQAMNQAAALLYQKKDFESFSKTRSNLTHHLCNIIEAKWLTKPHGQLVFRIKANRFLRGMVRSIVSNLLQVGLHQSNMSNFEHFIDQKNPTLGASLVPACGLALKEVSYPAGIFIEPELM